MVPIDFNSVIIHFDVLFQAIFAHNVSNYFYFFYNKPGLQPNNDIRLQTEYKLFAKYYLVKPNIQLFGCNPGLL